MEKVIFINYGELWLRGKNRQSYINQLKHNIVSLLEGEPYAYHSQHDRIILKPDREESIQRIIEKLSYLFGISKFGLAYGVGPKIEAIVDAAKNILSSSGYKKIKISAHRSYKGFSFDSMEIINKVSKVAKDLGIEPSLHDFDGEIFINVTKESAYIYDKYYKGLGGLPVGTSGKGVVLLSGGIDSPVAAWLAMKRGVVPIFVHLYKSIGEKEFSSEKIKELVSRLSLYAKGFKLKTYYLPAHYFSLKVAKVDPNGKYGPVLLKAFLFKLAEIVAKKEGAELIFTGESLGQVSSQTPANIAASQANSKMPILRPLIGFDKEEIINMARRIGTYNISIKPYPDVCGMNVRNPSTAAKKEVIKKMLKEMEIGKMAKATIKEAFIE
jgi:thiamine biosynthesis protein ThiI